jgi:hypothetical protein
LQFFEKAAPRAAFLLRDGQHRFEAAKLLGLPVCFVEHDTDAPIYVLNRPQKPWTPRDFAQSFADSGNKNYVTLMEIINEFNAPTAVVSRMLTGSLGGGANAKTRDFQTGNMVVKENYVPLTRKVLQCWMSLRQLAKHLSSGLCLQALWAAFHVDGVDTTRIVSGASRCGEKLIAYSTVDGYLDMIEQLHNYGRRSPLPIKVPAQEIMRRRNPATRGKLKDADE